MTPELIETAGICLKVRWEPGLRPRKSPHPTTGMFLLPQLLHLHQLSDLYRIEGIARPGNCHLQDRERSVSVMAKSHRARHLDHPRAACQTVLQSLLDHEPSNRKPNDPRASNGLIQT